MHAGLPVPQVVATMKGRGGLCPTTRFPGFTHVTTWEPTGEAPNFGQYDDEKLRTCMMESRCHVCWLTDGPLILCLPGLTSLNDAQRIQVGSRMAPMVLQPWVCPPCLAFACAHCPPLRAAIKSQRGLVVYPHATRLVMTAWKPAEADDPMPPLGAVVLSLIKVAILKARTVPLPEWAKKFGREPQP